MNNPNKSPGFRIYLLSVAGITLVALLLRTLALHLSLDEIGYFDSGALPTLTALLQLAAVLGAVIYPFIIKRNTLCINTALASGEKIFACLSALLLAVACVLVLISAADVNQPVLLAGVILSLLCGIAYFALRARGSDGSYALLGFGAILAAVLLISLTYFDLLTPMNAPRKISLHLSLLALMLYVLYEMRIALSRPMPRALITCAAVCFTVTVSMSGSNLLYAATHGDSLLYIAGDLFALSAGLFAGARMATAALSTPKADESEEVLA